MFFKILIFSLVACLLFVILKNYGKPFTVVFELAVGVALLITLGGEISSFISAFKDVLALGGDNGEIFLCLLKGAVITVLTKVGSEICLDSGSRLISSLLDLSGRVMLLALCLPFLIKTAQTAFSFVK